jgi:hypothetical protein
MRGGIFARNNCKTRIHHSPRVGIEHDTIDRYKTTPMIDRDHDTIALSAYRDASIVIFYRDKIPTMDGLRRILDSKFIIIYLYLHWL